MADRVYPLKNEYLGAGEGSEEDDGHPSETDAKEDRLACQGLFAGEAGKDGSDKLVTLYRDSDEWFFEDANNTGAGKKSLTDLVAGVGGLTPGQHENLDTLVHDIKETSFDDIEYQDPDKKKRVVRYTVWQTSAMLLRVRETLITYGTDELKKKPITTVVAQYDGAGVLKEKVTSTFTYDGKKIVNVSRVLA